LRRLLFLLLAAAAAAALVAGCSEGGGGAGSEPPAGGEPPAAGEEPPGEGTEPAGTDATGETGAAEEPAGPLVVGWLFPGAPDEAAVQAVESALGERAIVLVAENATPEADAAARAQALVDQDATFLVGAGLEFCEANPELHCLEIAAASDPPANVALYQPASWQLEYLLGLAAGRLTETGTTAYLAESKSPQSNAAVNAWALGCQTANPNCITRRVVLKQDQAGAEAAEKLGPGIDVVRSAVEDPRLCKLGGPAKPWLSFGGETPCPERTIAAPVVDIGAIVLGELERELAGEWTGGRTEIVGLGEGAGLGPWGPAVPAEVQSEVDAAAAAIEAGESVFVGPLYDKQGTERVSEGEELSEEFLASEWDWLLGGVLTG
jgi:basic membrane lipoprotein Med (substrate-binding protein (PBP1-ABC) superfamily)